MSAARAAIPPPLGALSCTAGEVHVLSGRTMGTTWSVRLSGAARPAGLAEAVQARLDGLVAQMSHWEPGSQISRFNAAPAGSWTEISPDFAAVAEAALRLAQTTGGAFDPCLGGAAARHGFGPPGAATDFAPGRWRALRLEDGRLLQPGGARLDLSGIAKGYAVDALAALLERRGHAAFLVEVGGELLGRGLKPDGQPWWAGVEAPREGCDPAVRVALPGWAVATSGDYRRYLEAGGRRRAHTLDPRTGDPLEGAPASVTVLAPRCMEADGWATALTVLGAEAGRACADAHGLPALFLVAQGGGLGAVASRAWEALWA